MVNGARVKGVSKLVGRPFGTWLVGFDDPPMNRWAIFGRPSGTGWSVAGIVTNDKMPGKKMPKARVERMIRLTSGCYGD